MHLLVDLVGQSCSDSSVPLCFCVCVCARAGRRACVCVTADNVHSPPPLRNTVGPQPNLARISHNYADRSGNGSNLNNLTHTPEGNFRGSKKSGKCHELSRKSIPFLTPTPPEMYYCGQDAQRRTGIAFISMEEVKS